MKRASRGPPGHRLGATSTISKLFLLARMDLYSPASSMVCSWPLESVRGRLRHKSHLPLFQSRKSVPCSSGLLSLDHFCKTNTCSISPGLIYPSFLPNPFPINVKLLSAIVRFFFWKFLPMNSCCSPRSHFGPTFAKMSHQCQARHLCRIVSPCVTHSGLCFQFVLARSSFVCWAYCLVYILFWCIRVCSNFLGVLALPQRLDRQNVPKNHCFKPYPLHHNMYTSITNVEKFIFELTDIKIQIPEQELSQTSHNWAHKASFAKVSCFAKVVLW